MGDHRGLHKFRVGPTCSQCHFPHSHSKREQSHHSESIQTHCTLQCDLQSHHEAHRKMSQNHPIIYYLSGIVRVRVGKEDHGQHYSSAQGDPLSPINQIT